jgi:hypothetical protein
MPPLALLGRQQGISRLRHRRVKDIQHANILVLPRYASQLPVHALRVLLGQLRYAANAQQFKVPQHRGSDRDQVC